MVEEETPDGQGHCDPFHGKLLTDKDIVILSMSETMENKGTKRYCHIFADVARVEDMDTNNQKP